MLNTILIHILSGDDAGVVDPFCARLYREWDIYRSVASPVQMESVQVVLNVKIPAYDLSTRIDVPCKRPRCSRDVDLCEPAVAQPMGIPGRSIRATAFE